MKVRKTTVPTDFLVSEFSPNDYSDAFECSFKSSKNITADDIQVAFWTEPPKWVNRLFKLRDILIKPFGIQSGEGKDFAAFAACIRSGGSHRFVSVPCKSDDETVLCLNDKHLIAYLSAKIIQSGDNKKVVMTTLVNFHNRLGKVYFFFICPFHGIVVRMTLKYVIKKLL